MTREDFSTLDSIVELFKIKKKVIPFEIRDIHWFKEDPAAISEPVNPEGSTLDQSPSPTELEQFLEQRKKSK
jgi:hypothetical protein